MQMRLFFKNAATRDTVLEKNIVFSAALKIIGLLCSLLIVPVTLDYLNKEVYGIWLTMSSILYWFSFFDIGLGNGMRNYLTQAISNDDYELGRSYLSTTLFLLCIIAFVMALVAIPLLSILDLSHIFNTSCIPTAIIRDVMIVAVAFTLVLFVVKNIGFVFVALQQYAINDLLIVSGNILALLIIYVLTLLTEGNLLYVVMAFTIVPVAIFLLASIPIFIKYPQLRPDIKHVDKKLMRQITGKGLGFFFIQITSCLVLFGAANLIISHYYGPSNVTIYNIAYKYFNLLAIGYTIVIAPMWNAYTDAYVKNDFHWINKTFNRAMKMWALTVMLGFVMLVCSNVFYKIWVKDVVEVPFSISFCTLIYISSFNFNNCVTYLLNGLNKIKVQIYTSLLMTIIFLIVILSVGSKIGVEGVILSIALSYIIMALIHFYQCKLLVKQKATGVWNK